MSTGPPAHVLVAALLVTSGCLGVLGPGKSPIDERAVDALNRSEAARDGHDTRKSVEPA